MTKLTESDRQNIVAFRRANPSTGMADIAARFGVDRSYVSYLCRKAGLGRSRAKCLSRDRHYAPKVTAPKPEIRANALPWATRERLMAGNGRVARRSV